MASTMYVCLCTRLGLPICRSDLLAPPMTGGSRSPRPLGTSTTAGHVPFEDLLYRGLEEGLVVAPPPRPRTSHAAGSRCNMFLGVKLLHISWLPICAFSYYTSHILDNISLGLNWNSSGILLCNMVNGREKQDNIG
jgi:hypothetical protein